MIERNLFKTAALLAIILACLSIAGCESKEHPTEHPAGEEKTTVTKDQLADAIEAYIQKEAAEQGGYFPIIDDKIGERLQMKLVKVHRKRLSRIGKDRYFACVDFKTPAGKIYDVDFFMEGPDKDNLTYSEFMIHKEAGEERYTWYEQGGIWKKKPAAAAVEKAVEQPTEHPTEQPTEHPTEHPK